jgi:hypothetical protein
MRSPADHLMTARWTLASHATQSSASIFGPRADASRRTTSLNEQSVAPLGIERSLVSPANRPTSLTSFR